MHTLNGGIVEKLSGLLFFLKRSKTEFEMVADEIENYSLKTALNGLSEESNHYENELTNYLQLIGINDVHINYDGEDDLDLQVDVNAANAYGYELHNICASNERYLTNAYQQLLDESLPTQSLKELILYQLNALTNTFLKIKTLNTARFAMY